MNSVRTLRLGKANFPCPLRRRTLDTNESLKIESTNVAVYRIESRDNRLGFAGVGHRIRFFVLLSRASGENLVRSVVGSLVH
jgi:hypothetical protein